MGLYTDCIHVTSVTVPDMWQVKRQSGGTSHWLHTCYFCYRSSVPVPDMWQTKWQSGGASHWLHTCNFCTCTWHVTSERAIRWCFTSIAYMLLLYLYLKCDKWKGDQVGLHTDCIHVISVPVPDIWQIKGQSGGDSHRLHTCYFCTCTWHVTSEKAIRWDFSLITYIFHLYLYLTCD